MYLHSKCLDLRSRAEKIQLQRGRVIIVSLRDLS